MGIIKLDAKGNIETLDFPQGDISTLIKATGCKAGNLDIRFPRFFYKRTAFKSTPDGDGCIVMLADAGAVWRKNSAPNKVANLLEYVNDEDRYDIKGSVVFAKMVDAPEGVWFTDLADWEQERTERVLRYLVNYVNGVRMLG